MVGLARKWMVGAIIPKGDLYFLGISSKELNVHSFIPQMQMGIAAIVYDKMNNREIAVKYVKKALPMYTDQGNYAGVAMAAQKLKQIAPDS